MYQDFFGKNDDYLSEFKQKVAEQKIATLEEHRAELAHSRNNFLGTIAGIGLACVVGWFVLMPQYKQQNKEIPVIRRPQTAVKIKPENPGGMEIPNQDKNVYSIVEKKDIDNTVVENLLPTPEQPKLPDIVPDETTVVDENADNLDEIVDEVAEETDTATTTATTTADEAISDVVNNKPKDILAEADGAIETAKVETPKAETPKTTEVKSAPQKQETVPSKPEVLTGGNWQIQLVASKNKAAVENTLNTLSTKYTQLKSYTHEVQKADLGAQGVIYKLRAGSFASKNEAQAACAALKAKGLTDCIAKER